MTKLRHLFGDDAEMIDSLLDAIEAANDARHAADPDDKRKVIEATAPLHTLTREKARAALDR